MNPVDRPGTFRGTPTEWGVSETKNKYPQFVVRIKAEEFYDEEKGEYVPWGEYEQESVGFFVLYTKDAQSGQWKELLNAKQVKQTFGWDGLSFEGLAGGQYADKKVLFRMAEETYNGNTSLKMTWLDTADANPVKTLAKFDTDKLKTLTASMGGALQGAAPAPVSAKPATAKPPKKALPKPAATGSAKSGAPSTATPPPAGAPATAKPAPSPAPSSTVPDGPPETKDSAWAGVNELKDAKTTDEKLAEVWIAEVGKIGKDEDKMTSEDWATVKNAVHAQTSLL